MLRFTSRSSAETYAASFQPPYVSSIRTIMKPNEDDAGAGAVAVAAAWSTGDQELDFGAEVLPRTGEFGPALAFNRECARWIETSSKDAKLQRRCGQ